MGDFHPDAQVKGLDGCNLIALICKRNSATCSAVSFLFGMAQIYRIYVNDKRIIIASRVNNDYPSDNNTITEKQLFSVLTNMVSGIGLANFMLFTPFPEKIMTGLR